VTTDGSVKTWKGNGGECVAVGEGKSGSKSREKMLKWAKWRFSAFFILSFIKNVLPLQRKMNEGAEKFPHFNI
jgi:hypothetical protein